MVCPKCFHTNTQVYNSRSTKRTNSIWRRRRCTSCSYSFTTTEQADSSIYTVVNSRAEETLFSFITLLYSIMEFSRHLPQQEDAYHLAKTIETKVLTRHTDLRIATQSIRDEAYKVLSAFDTQLYLSYLARYGGLKSRLDIQAALRKQAKSR